METAGLVQTLQTAIGPVVLVSGVGLLLLTMTNRLGRVVDRARLLARERRGLTGEARDKLEAQLVILGQRARLLRLAIALAAFCVLFAAVLVISLFITALAGASVPWLIAGLFILSMGSLIAAMVEFIRDINKALQATALEVGEEWEKRWGRPW
ncbi:MAG TPA: DUF2721 domain-containing protein [Chloroflexota bacterium]|nr:DUF2721 domain-containing protein [Chloroflexota bacterium]